MKISKHLIKKLIIEQMQEENTPVRLSIDKVDRLREMKTELQEMVDMLGPDVDDLAEMSMLELVREFETTISAFEP
jgi:phosphoglucomutase